jgi:uncharacterized protein (TIGR03083 family)
VIHAERRSLASDLAALGADGWSTRSLCENWSVRDVAAHMTATAKITPASFFPKLFAAGFSMTRMQDKDIAVEKGNNDADTLARFEGVLDSTKHPPGPADTWLGETIVHAEDIRRPLGISHGYPPAALVQIADFYQGSNLLIGAKRRIDGLALRSTDADWSHGSGPEVKGPLLSLVLAMTGRKAVLSDLAGDGVATLQARP